MKLLIYLNIYLNILLIFRERGREGEGEKNISRLPLTRMLAQVGDPRPQPRRLPGRGTEPVCRMMPNPLSHTSQGKIHFLKPLKDPILMEPFFHKASYIPLNSTGAGPEGPQALVINAQDKLPPTAPRPAE